MKKFTITSNHYLQNDTRGYYNCDYTGYQKHGNPDFINRLKNMSNQYSELDLVMDFIQVFENAYRDIKLIISNAKLSDCAIAVIPRSKAEQQQKPLTPGEWNIILDRCRIRALQKTLATLTNQKSKTKI